MYLKKHICKDYNYSCSRAIAFYVYTHKVNKLIEHKKMLEISKNYHKYLKKEERVN